MNHFSLLKSGVWGFITGVLLVPVAALGLRLQIRFIELLKPVLIPGNLFTSNVFTLFVLNGLIYALLFVIFKVILSF